MTAADREVIVVLPDGLPRLTCDVSRTLLAVLVDLTTVELLDEPPEGEPRDC